MTKLYKRDADLNRHYKDGSRAKDLGAAISTNPFTVSSEQYFVWQDGWNKIAIELTPGRVNMLFNTAVTATDPGYGQIGFNNAAMASVTSIRVNLTAYRGSDLQEPLTSLKAGDVLKIMDEANPTGNYGTFTVVSRTITTYGTVAVTYSTSAGSMFIANQPIVVQRG